jgi:hypothetical protein
MHVFPTALTDVPAIQKIASQALLVFWQMVDAMRCNSGMAKSAAGGIVP